MSTHDNSNTRNTATRDIGMALAVAIVIAVVILLCRSCARNPVAEPPPSNVVTRVITPRKMVSPPRVTRAEQAEATNTSVVVPVASNAVVVAITADVGRVVGVIRTTEGDPVPGYRVSLDPISARYQFRDPGSDAPTDSNGIFTISAIPAPGTYHSYVFPINGAAGKPYIRLNNGETVRVKQGETTPVFITMQALPEVFLKVRDEDDRPVLSYHKKIRSVIYGCYGPVMMTSDTWHRVFSWAGPSCTGSAADLSIPLSIVITTDTGTCAQTNIVMQTDTTNDVYLTMQVAKPAEEDKELLASGWLKFVDGMPVTNGYAAAYCIGITTNGRKGRIGPVVTEKVDATGRFELYGKRATGNELLSVQAHCDIAWLLTNVVKGSVDVVLTLPWRRYVTGRVCIGSPETPATNYWHTISGHGNGSGGPCHDSNGRFKEENYGSGTWCVIGIDCPPFALVLVKVEQTSDTLVDIGDIILTAPASMLHGRAVARDKAPIAAEISVEPLDASVTSIMHYKHTKTDDMQGEFDFAGMATGRYCITAIAGAATTTTEVVIHRFGETVTVPDIVIDTAGDNIGNVRDGE